MSHDILERGRCTSNAAELPSELHTPRASDLRLRAERRIGELLRDDPDYGRGRQPVTAADFDISHGQAKRWQRIAQPSKPPRPLTAPGFGWHSVNWTEIETRLLAQAISCPEYFADVHVVKKFPGPRMKRSWSFSVGRTHLDSHPSWRIGALILLATHGRSAINPCP